MSNLSAVDAAWYEMEHPTNLMMISGTLMLTEPANIEDVRHILNERLAQSYYQFRSYVVRSTVPGVSYRWEEDKFFDINYHVRHISLPEPGTKEQFEDFVSTMMSTPLDLNRAPWQVQVIDNYEGGGAIFIRLHHVVGDGISLIRTLLNVTAPTAEESLTIPERKSRKKRSFTDQILKSIFDTVESAQSMADAVFKESQKIQDDPNRLVDLSVNAVETSLTGAASTAKLLFMPPDPMTPLKGPLGVIKLAKWTHQLPLQAIKEIGKVTGTKVNDVLMAAMAGALRRYLISIGEDVTDMNFRAAIPVNLRPLDENRPQPLGNEFGLVFLRLPIGIEDSLDRLMETKRRMDGIKNSAEAVVAFGILNFLGVAVDQLREMIVNMFGTKATLVATNVPGPRERMYIFGREVHDLMFWVPQSGKLGIGVSILSYAGKVTLGVAVDRGLIPDPEKIIDGFYAEFDALHALVTQAEEIDQASSEAPSESVEAEEPAEAEETAESAQSEAEAEEDEIIEVNLNST